MLNQLNELDMAKVLETWLLWDDKNRTQQWEYLVSCTSKKQVESFSDLCHGYFNGCALCDGSTKALKNEEWFIKDYSEIPLISYKKFREFLATL